MRRMAGALGGAAIALPLLNGCTPPAQTCGDPANTAKVGQAVCDKAIGVQVRLDDVHMVPGEVLAWQAGNIHGGWPVALATYSVKNISSTTTLDLQGVTIALSWHDQPPSEGVPIGPAQYVETPLSPGCDTYTLPPGEETRCVRAVAPPISLKIVPADVVVHWWNHADWPDFKWSIAAPAWSPSPSPSLIIEAPSPTPQHGRQIAPSYTPPPPVTGPTNTPATPPTQGGSGSFGG